jgi:hypothetical protein
MFFRIASWLSAGYVATLLVKCFFVIAERGDRAPPTLCGTSRYVAKERTVLRWPWDRRVVWLQTKAHFWHSELGRSNVRYKIHVPRRATAWVRSDTPYPGPRCCDFNFELPECWTHDLGYVCTLVQGTTVRCVCVFWRPSQVRKHEQHAPYIL